MTSPMLTEQTDGLWTADDPSQRFYGLRVGTRTSLIRLPSGGLLVYSPIALSDELAAAVTALGPVEHIVAPNIFHHLYVTDWTAAYPDARLHMPSKLAKKRTDLPAHRPLGDGPDPDWGGAMDLHPLDGFDLLAETLVFHAPTRTLLVADLLENFDEDPDHWFTKTYLSLAGIRRKPGISRVLAAAFNNRKAASASIDAVLDWDFDRVVMCHGTVLPSGGKDILRAAYTWLPGR